jgi:hypothetical protein
VEIPRGVQNTGERNVCVALATGTRAVNAGPASTPMGTTGTRSRRRLRQS